MLQVKDVTLQKSKLLVQIKGSKTDPFCEGVTLTISKTGSFMCPVCTMKRYLPAHPSKTGPLFQMVSRGYLTRAIISKLLKETLQSSGIDATRYSSHSFRIGAATTAAAAGIPDRIIKTLGRWSSNCYQRYIQLPLSTLTSIPGTMARVRKITKTWTPK